MRRIPIKEILTNVPRRREFMHNVNPIVNDSLRESMISSTPDKIIWKKDPSGVVTVKSFMKSFLPPVITRPEFEIIWQGWIPLKVSCFLWRVLHKALPTNENVVRVGISMASKCVCCALPNCESMEHLFMHSDMADILWGSLCSTFRRQRPHSLRCFFYDWGIRPDFKRFSNLFAFGLACLCLWEVWKIRSARVYDEGIFRFTKHTVSNCAASLARLVPSKCQYDTLARRVCSLYGISTPLVQEFKIFWSPWRPSPYGNTCNIAIHQHENKSLGAAIIRNLHGDLVYAIKFSSNAKHFLKSFFHLMNELKDKVFSCIQASQEDIFLLSKEADVDWDIFQIKRKLVASIRQVIILKVSFSLNKPAQALCFSEIESLRSGSLVDLPLGVKVALDEDCFLHPCSSREQQVFL